MWHAWGERCLQGFGREARREKTTGRPRRRWENNIKMDLREMGINAGEMDLVGSGWVQWRAL
jgi:hypothetical protein